MCMALKQKVTGEINRQAMAGKTIPGLKPGTLADGSTIPKPQAAAPAPAAKPEPGLTGNSSSTGFMGTVAKKTLLGQ